MALNNQELLEYIEKRAKYNVKDKKFFRNTDILKEAFLISEERAYEILKDIMIRKNIKNTKEAIIDEYLYMLGNGYASLKEQFELFGGHKLPAIKKEAELRFKNFNKGSIIDVFKEVYHIDDEDIPDMLVKYMNSMQATEFIFKANIDTFNKFLEDNFEELDKQAKRYDL
ncbi:hypothetical protein CLPUN_37840 [Clostridium puniceum]|uniref:Uncharacterized protein n=1 Tax=Clostridium puniceum TaxID=29367 RepID=A0A1S8TAL3_9CLOT|nr:hypothetical protein [Clostridium puniceum]OOM74659.1 hypothetical protein CLPUN_37840 [Clostridium puniceum]